MTNFMGSTVKAILGFTVFWFIFLWFAMMQNAEAVKKVTALSWRFSGPKIITPHGAERMKTAMNISGGSSCADYVTSAELRHGIPENLLQAVAKVESGKVDKNGQVVSWPWTVNVEGKGYFYPSKQAAIDAVKQFQREGKRSIDVGCMQVNLKHHPDAFASLSAAFDPHQNVEYAARFLKGLRNEQANWHQAVAHYHSANPEHHIPYRKRVMAQWSKEKKTGRNDGNSKTKIMANHEGGEGKVYRLNDKRAYARENASGQVRKVTSKALGRRSVAAMRKASAGPKIIKASANLSETKKVGREVKAVASGK